MEQCLFFQKKIEVIYQKINVNPYKVFKENIKNTRQAYGIYAEESRNVFTPELNEYNFKLLEEQIENWDDNVGSWYWDNGLAYDNINYFVVICFYFVETNKHQ